MKINKPISHSSLTNDPLHKMFDEVDAISVQGYDEERRVIYWNAGSESLYGYSKEEALGQKLEQLIIPKPLWEHIIPAHSNWVHNNIEIPASEITLLNKAGEDVNVFSSHVMFVNQENKKQMYCVDIDLSDVRYAQEQAIFKEKMLEAVFEASPDLFFLMTEEGIIIDYRAHDKKSLYIPPNKFIGKSMVDVLPEHVANKFKLHFNRALQQEGEASFEYELAMPYGMVYFEARISHLPDNKQILGIVRDITERHKSSEIIRQHAYFDTLTLLPNRFLALDRLSQMLNEAERNNECAAVFFIDLDDFKKVNDSLGHEVGDKLLIAAANRLNSAIRKEDTVGRLGGDEFIVLIRDIKSDHDASIIADALLNIFREPLRIDGRELILTLSIGISMYPQNGDNASELLRNSDIAMYQAKALGRNAYSFFTKEMNVTMLRRFEIEEQMHGALERNEFEVYYQPLLDVKTKKIIGAEALLRWHNHSLGHITPDEFIPIAEHTGLIIPIGQFVIQQALSFLTYWQQVTQNKYVMAVNLSPSQFRDKELFNFVKNILRDENLTANSLELEITEGVLMTGQSYVAETLMQFDLLGVKLSMDDFGTGYSSLSYLRQYAFDVLKIDRSFINGITLNDEDRNLVKAAIAMAHSLGLAVVAEGVEMHGQLLLLEELGCDFAQGFYFSKPVPAEQFITLSKNYKLDEP
ncbi:bifunctional diguanylate cyclase/phosphodiesterase [Psychromonas sp. SR45-3]|uniref:bifunctional diguanylate cyclase/phosphodiesterase n=1 Tax=Psychromonas sp. SR45-3 TaxID=2760930 RepID=UPI0015FB7941|nr:bifunctional diguanylate cyclase/phosphodiesterase [Psychromonas sp. SR45-3]MBB1274760.1 EAL domain-containing protein [Psychromonas sp. SR45-3]